MTDIYVIMDTLEQDTSGRFRLVLREGHPFGRLYQNGGGRCRLEFIGSPYRSAVMRSSLGEMYADLVNGEFTEAGP